MYETNKRFVDLLVSLPTLIVASPLLLAIAVAIRWRMGRPVLFRHERPGLYEKPFLCWKFRTMTDARDATGELLSDRERLTGVGRFLRRYSLDELPQLWNVVRGEMTLVGPRPLEMRYLSRYSAEQRRRHLVKPGITGWAQIHGRNAIAWERRFALDVWYVEHRSLGLDLKILVLTPWIVIRARGISQAGHATMSDFVGKTQA